MLEKIILSKDEAKNLQLIEEYNNLLYDTVCVLYEFVGEVDIREMSEYNYTVSLVRELEPQLTVDEATKVCNILKIFEGKMYDLCKQIKLQVFKGAMNEYALEIIKEWEQFPSTFPLSN